MPAKTSVQTRDGNDPIIVLPMPAWTRSSLLDSAHNFWSLPFFEMTDCGAADDADPSCSTAGNLHKASKAIAAKDHVNRRAVCLGVVGPEVPISHPKLRNKTYA